MLLFFNVALGLNDFDEAKIYKKKLSFYVSSEKRTVGKLTGAHFLFSSA
jgi:hypothetical protein